MVDQFSPSPSQVGPKGLGVPDRGAGGGVLDGLASLVEKSLLRQEGGRDGESRVVMLATIREFATVALVEGGEV